MKSRKTPLRTCVGCHEKKEKKEMIRVVRTPDLKIVLDDTGKAPGRGAYICRQDGCFKKAIQNKALTRALQMEIDDDILVELSNQVIDDE